VPAADPPPPSAIDEAASDPEPVAAESEPAPEPAPAAAEAQVEEPPDSSNPVEETHTNEEPEEDPAALLDAPPPEDSEAVTWIVAESKTQEMSLQEAAMRAASGGEPENPPAAFEDLGAVRVDLEERAKDAATPPLRRPLFRVGEVPIYDEPDFLTELKRELSKCRRVDRPLTLILIRVGDLGQIIELFGKDFRERVLWHIAEQAMQSLREVDLVGMMTSKSQIALTAFASDRYGGGRIVARLRQAMHRKPFRVGEELPPIVPALDFGMASFPADGDDVSTLMARADEDLPAAESKPAALD
jgi:diguanylate cyclase (GGDEF)-like protein